MEGNKSEIIKDEQLEEKAKGAEELEERERSKSSGFFLMLIN